jgi:hypothetical protein
MFAVLPTAALRTSNVLHLTLTSRARRNTARAASKSLIFAKNVLYSTHSRAEPGHCVILWPPF